MRLQQFWTSFALIAVVLTAFEPVSGIELSALHTFGQSGLKRNLPSGQGKPSR